MAEVITNHVKQTIGCSAYVYADDFFVGAHDYETCRRALELLWQTLERAGFEISENKSDRVPQ
jgi:hypothetical protein